MSKVLFIDTGLSCPVLLAETFDQLVGPSLTVLVVSPNRDFYRRWQKDYFRLLPLDNLLGFGGSWKLRRLIKKEGVTKLLLLEVPEKIRFTKMAAKLGLQVIWLEAPANSLSLKVELRPKLDNLAKLATSVCFTAGVRESRLAAGWPEAQVRLLRFGLKPVEATLAAMPVFPWQNRPSALKHDLTIGTVVDLSEVQKIEELLRLVKSTDELALSIQLIVIGEGGERGKLAWLAKKMDIENQVWLVGERSRLDKWYSFFDLLIISSRQADIEDLRVAQGALAAGIPVLAAESEAMSDCLVEGESGYWVDLSKTDELAAMLKSLYQDSAKMKAMSMAGQKRAKEIFNNDECLEAWGGLVNS
ncbi:MAG: glycosyltransferase [Candidatus Falkowbacteria bacterium]